MILRQTTTLLSTSVLVLLLLCCFLAITTPGCSSFTVQQQPRLSVSHAHAHSHSTVPGALHHQQHARGWSGAQPKLATTALYATSTTNSDTNSNSEPDVVELEETIDSMRAGAIKKELESYGISTKAFLEKSELVQALTKARADGLTPQNNNKKQAAAATTTASSTSTSSSSTSSTAGSTGASGSSSNLEEETFGDSRPRAEQLQEAMFVCNALKNAELKQELQARGISTKSFFEKSEFVKALAAAMVDGVVPKTTTGNSQGSNTNGNSSGSNNSNSDSDSNNESYAEYDNVEVLTDDNSGPRQKGSSVKPAKSAGSGKGSGGGGGGSGNPFADMMGGMGGMGGMADMLKNMGGMGGGGGAANPFEGMGGGGGGGGMGGMGDTMGKAQEAMKNPKVRELLAKAQSNPKIMKAMTEVMSNPMAFAKYQNDPECAEFIKELQKYM
jgi:hypothetical protein